MSNLDYITNYSFHLSLSVFISLGFIFYSHGKKLKHLKRFDVNKKNVVLDWMMHCFLLKNCCEVSNGVL